MQGENKREQIILERKGIAMKRLIILLTILTWCLGTVIASASANIIGSVYPTRFEDGSQLRVARGEGSGGLMWDVSAPKHGKKSAAPEIWLIRSDINFDAIPYAAVQRWYQEGIIPENQPLYYTKADEKGHFAFENIPPAVYYVLILDPKGKEASQTLAERSNREELWAKLPNVAEFEFFTVGTRTCLVEKVTLQEGHTVKIRPGII